MADLNLTSALSGILIEAGPRYYQHAINNNAPLMKKGGPLPQEDVEGMEWTCLVSRGAFASTALVADGGNRPTADAATPKEGTALPAQITATLKLGRLARLAKAAKEGKLSTLMDFHLKTSAEDVARVGNRALYGVGVTPQATATWSNVNQTGTVTVSFEDVSAFRAGQLCDFIDTSASLSYRIRVSAVSYSAVGTASANVAGTVTFANDVVNPATGADVDLGSTAVAVDDVFRPAGYAAGFGGADTKVTALNSFDDIAGTGSSSTLHGISTSDVGDWVGQKLNLNAPITQEAVMAFANRVYTVSGSYPKKGVTHPQVIAALASASGVQGNYFGHASAIGVSGAAVRQIGGDFDKYAGLGDGIAEKSGVMVAGIEMFADPNAPATRLHLFDPEHLKLAKWGEIGPEQDASGNPFHVDQSAVAVKVFMTDDLQLVTDKRPTVGILYGITSL